MIYFLMLALPMTVMAVIIWAANKLAAAIKRGIDEIDDHPWH